MDSRNGRTDPAALDRTGKLKTPINLQLQERGKNILNLSRKHVLSEAEKALLDRGLSFIPTWKTNDFLKNKLRTDLNNYHRKIKLLAYFENKKKKSIVPFKLKSNWSPPPKGVPETINKIIEKDSNYFNRKFDLERPQTNLNKREIKALQALAKNKEIIIKPADKGSVVVIQDRFRYLWEGNRQLSDDKYYKKLKEPIFPETQKMIEK